MIPDSLTDDLLIIRGGMAFDLRAAECAVADLLVASAAPVDLSRRAGPTSAWAEFHR